MKSVEEFINEILMKANKPVDEDAIRKRLKVSIKRRQERLELLEKKKNDRANELERLEAKLKPGLDFYYKHKDDLYFKVYPTKSGYTITVGVYDTDGKGKSYVGDVCFCSPSDKFSIRTARGLICGKIYGNYVNYLFDYNKSANPLVPLRSIMFHVLAFANSGDPSIPSRLSRDAMSEGGRLVSDHNLQLIHPM